MAIAAVVVAGVGIGVGVVREHGGTCDALRGRQAAIEHRFGPGPPQRWEQIVAFQRVEAQYFQVRAAADDAGCS